MTERFANGDPKLNPPETHEWGGKPELDNFFGGDLQGVLDHLHDLTELGVNAIYFTPLFQANSYHKYDTIDYKKVDPHFGDNALLKQLTEECHRLGIRVMLDAVFNHCSEDFPPFQDVLQNGKTQSMPAGSTSMNIRFRSKTVSLPTIHLVSMATCPSSIQPTQRLKHIYLM